MQPPDTELERSLLTNLISIYRARIHYFEGLIQEIDNRKSEENKNG